MKTIDIFYQGEGIGALEHIEFGADDSFAAFRRRSPGSTASPATPVLFLEDEIEPVDERPASRQGRPRRHQGPPASLPHVEVAVHFKGKTVHARFAPGTTVARVKHWAAVRKFGMTEEEASDHLLQIAGTTDQPDPGTHIGTLASCPKCKVAFDLVTTPKVNG